MEVLIWIIAIILALTFAWVYSDKPYTKYIRQLKESNKSNKSNQKQKSLQDYIDELFTYPKFKSEVEKLHKEFNIENKIVSVAIKSDCSEIIYSIPKPYRHNDLVQLIYPIKGTQGFLLANGTFVDRVMAGKIALYTGQIKKLKWPPRLYSEDLW